MRNLPNLNTPGGIKLSQQFFTLAGTLLGALLGLAAPMIAASSSRREKGDAAQRETAAQIIGLFEESGSLRETFTQNESAVRWRLYLLAVKLESKVARESCLEFIAMTGREGAGEDDLLGAWQSMMDQVGLTYRRSRRGES